MYKGEMNMNVSNFTEKSKEMITSASNITTSNNNPEITDFHLMEISSAVVGLR